MEKISPNIDIKGGQEFITQQFLHFYTERGYAYLPSASLLPDNDQSVLFTGATITPLKKFIEQGVPSPGICIVQKCLRTKRLDEMTDLSVIPDWTHYFTMCGILSAPGRVDEVSGEAYELLTNTLKIPRDDLLVEASSMDKDLSHYWHDNGIRIVENTWPENYYRWKYGIPHVTGRGINFLARSNQDSLYRDLGNMVSVENDTGNVEAYEFGFGLESFLSRMHGLKKPMEASLLSSVIPYKEGLQEKFIDVLMAAIVIFHQGVEPGRGKQRHVLKKLIKGLSFLRRKMELDFEQIEDWCNKFEGVEFGSESYEEDLITGIKSYEQSLMKYVDYAKNQVHAHRLRDDVGDRLIDKLRREGGNLGILPIEIEEVINSVLI